MSLNQSLTITSVFESTQASVLKNRMQNVFYQLRNIFKFYHKLKIISSDTSNYEIVRKGASCNEIYTYKKHA